MKKIQILAVSVLSAGIALGAAAPAVAAPATPAICSNHEEQAYVPHTKGSIYKAACAVGRGDGAVGFQRDNP